MKNKIKILATIILTIVAQYLVIKENGHWVAGGNVGVPILCYLLFWMYPRLIKDIIKMIKTKGWENL